jgi:hypothetical protein
MDLEVIDHMLIPKRFCMNMCDLWLTALNSLLMLNWLRY